MNPLKWTFEQRIVLGLAVVLGASLGIIFGHIVFAIDTGSGVPFAKWWTNWIRFNVWKWGFSGGVCSAGVVCLFKLLSGDRD